MQNRLVSTVMRSVRLVFKINYPDPNRKYWCPFMIRLPLPVPEHLANICMLLQSRRSRDSYPNPTKRNPGLRFILDVYYDGNKAALISKDAGQAAKKLTVTRAWMEGPPGQTRFLCPYRHHPQPSTHAHTHTQHNTTQRHPALPNLPLFFLEWGSLLECFDTLSTAAANFLLCIAARFRSLSTQQPFELPHLTNLMIFQIWTQQRCYPVPRKSWV